MECPICLDEYNVDTRPPKMIRCGHSACLQCLRQVPNCPRCRRQFFGRPEDLPTNFDLLGAAPASRANADSEFWCLECGGMASADCRQRHPLIHPHEALRQQVQGVTRRATDAVQGLAEVVRSAAGSAAGDGPARLALQLLAGPQAECDITVRQGGATLTARCSLGQGDDAGAAGAAGALARAMVCNLAAQGRLVKAEPQNPLQQQAQGQQPAQGQVQAQAQRQPPPRYEPEVLQGSSDDSDPEPVPPLLREVVIPAVGPLRARPLGRPSERILARRELMRSAIARRRRHGHGEDFPEDIRIRFPLLREQPDGAGPARMAGPAVGANLNPVVLLTPLLPDVARPQEQQPPEEQPAAAQGEQAEEAEQQAEQAEPVVLAEEHAEQPPAPPAPIGPAELAELEELAAVDPTGLPQQPLQPVVHPALRLPAELRWRNYPVRDQRRLLPANPIPTLDMRELSDVDDTERRGDKLDLLETIWQEGVKKVDHLICSKDPAWARDVLDAAWQTCEELSLLYPGVQHLRTMLTMPRLRRLAIKCGEQTREERLYVAHREISAPHLEWLSLYGLSRTTTRSILRQFGMTLETLRITVGTPGDADWPQNSNELDTLFTDCHFHQLRRLVLNRGGVNHCVELCFPQKQALRRQLPRGVHVLCGDCDRYRGEPI